VTWFLMLVGSKVGRLVASVLGVLGSILLIFKVGQRDQKKEQEIKNLEDYKDTREKIDEVVVNTDVDAAVKRLSKDGAFRD
jgi:hypothetical protein